LQSRYPCTLIGFLRLRSPCRNGSIKVYEFPELEDGIVRMYLIILKTPEPMSQRFGKILRIPDLKDGIASMYLIVLKNPVDCLVSNVLDLRITQRAQVAFDDVLTLCYDLALDTEHVDVVFRGE
jgi:hypothetical protein